MYKSNESDFLIFIDYRFSKMAEKELMSAVPNCTLEPYKVYKGNAFNTVFFKLHVADADGALSTRIKNSIFSFADFVLPIDLIIDITNAIDYREIESAISKIIEDGKYASFKLESKRIDYPLDKTAKSIEVLLGQDLEKAGYVVDLQSPEVVIYIVLLSSSIIIGHVNPAVQKNNILDSFRKSNKNNSNVINRAQFKIEEAVDFFDIDLNRHNLCLDVGASPGGWTYYLSQHGVKVVAIDSALLDYEQICIDKKVLVLTDDTDYKEIEQILLNGNMSGKVSVMPASSYTSGMDSYDIIHIKSNINLNNTGELLRQFGKFNLLTIDMNMDFSVSTGIADSMSQFLEADAILVMTIKLPTDAFSEHISNAITELSKNYTDIHIKKLPHNRKEVTVCGMTK